MCWLQRTIHCRHFLLECGDFTQLRNNCFHVDNMKQLFQGIHIDSVMTFLRQINLLTKSNAIFKIMFCFTFVSDHNTDSILLYSVQLKNMYSYLKNSLKLSDIVRGLPCQQSYCNLLSLYKFIIIIIPFILSYKFALFPSTSCLV